MVILLEERLFIVLMEIVVEVGPLLVVVTRGPYIFMPVIRLLILSWSRLIKHTIDSLCSPLAYYLFF